MTELEERWLGVALALAPALGAEEEVTITDAGVPEGIGYSAETLVFTASYRTGGQEVTRKLVFRGETPEPPVYPAQLDGIDVEIAIQHRVMTAVAEATAIPVAPIVAADLSGETAGAPWFVMDFVEGDVPPVDPPYPAAGFFAEAPPDGRRTMIAEGVRAMAAVHGVDWEAAGLGWLVPDGVEPTLHRQLELWAAYADRELAGRDHPAMAKALGRLRADLPEPSSPTLCWGDPRPGNIIWRDFRPAVLTDWEAAAVAPPELDVGWWLMFDRSCHEVPGIDRPEGEPTREEQRETYAEAVGRDLGDTWIHELFAAYRYSAIVVRIMNRWVDRGIFPADHPAWRENPAADCLTQLLEL